jgi:hypothetical protein
MNRILPYADKRDAHPRSNLRTEERQLEEYRQHALHVAQKRGGANHCFGRAKRHGGS